MESALAERESQYRSIVESTGDGVLVTDLTNAVVAVNPAFCTITGYSAEQLRTLHPREFLHLDDLQPFDAYLARTATADVVTAGVLCVCADGRLTRLELRGKRFSYGGTRARPVGRARRDRARAFAAPAGTEGGGADARAVDAARDLEHRRIEPAAQAAAARGAGAAADRARLHGRHHLRHRGRRAGDPRSPRPSRRRGGRERAPPGPADDRLRAGAKRQPAHHRQPLGRQRRGARVPREGPGGADGAADAHPFVAARAAAGSATGRSAFLLLDNDEPDRYSTRDGTLAWALANQAAVAIENARLYDHARELAAFEERQRLARDLHDSVTQSLYTAAMLGRVLPGAWESDQKLAREMLGAARRGDRGGARRDADAAAGAASGRDPADGAGGSAARGWRGRCARHLEKPIQVEIEGSGQLPGEVHIAFYRLAQAALGNVVRHASSSQARVRLVLADASATLVISDDGGGFDPDALGERQGMGFEIMRERAAAIGADLKIDSAIGQGTTVTLRWPA